MLIRRGLLVAFTVMRVIFIRVWCITLILEHIFMVFLFIEVVWSDTFDFCIWWRISRCTLWTTWYSGVYVATPLPWGTKTLLLGTSLVFPGLNFFRFIRFGFYLEALLRLLGSLSVTLACRVLVVLGRSSWAHSGRSLALREYERSEERRVLP